MKKKFPSICKSVFVFALLLNHAFSNAQTTQLIAPDCGASNVDVNQFLHATNVGGANQYEFKVANSSSSYSETIQRTTNNFRMMDLAGPVNYNTTYNVNVRAKVGNNWGSFGSICQVTTKPQPITQLIASDCGASNVDVTQLLNANVVPNANQYEFNVSNTTLNYNETITKQTNSFSMIELANPVQWSSTYQVRVRPITGIGG
ncbi:MAG: hypothetical protein Q7K43_01195, partial [Candidatus Woesearchaeota archaeon]|nr:hypothetical protein [Candidatus Woesearchaeota archaeon]